MLYKFKSDAGADVIMLEANGRQVLEIIGKGADAKGILLPEQMATARAALEAAIAREEAQDTKADEEDEETQAAPKRISLRTRAWPLVMLIEHSTKAKVPITWGV
jgi:Domain of unknown function (DUF1840)